MSKKKQNFITWENNHLPADKFEDSLGRPYIACYLEWCVGLKVSQLKKIFNDLTKDRTLERKSKTFKGKNGSLEIELVYSNLPDEPEVILIKDRRKEKEIDNLSNDYLYFGTFQCVQMLTELYFKSKKPAIYA